MNTEHTDAPITAESTQEEMTFVVTFYKDTGDYTSVHRGNDEIRVRRGESGPIRYAVVKEDGFLYYGEAVSLTVAKELGAPEDFRTDELGPGTKPEWGYYMGRTEDETAESLLPDVKEHVAGLGHDLEEGGEYAARAEELIRVLFDVLVTDLDWPCETCSPELFDKKSSDAPAVPDEQEAH